MTELLSTARTRLRTLGGLTPRAFHTRSFLENIECGLSEIALRFSLFRLGFGFWHPPTVARIPMNEHSNFKLTHYRRSQGVSIRLMKGVYYRVGAFKGHPVENTERVEIDTGWVVVTDKNIYFAGPRKGVRLPYAKIVSFEPFSDGIGVMRDAATAKAQIFVTGDGWFTYNLVTNLSRGIL